MALTARNTHRDLAYFYLGLIISFSISGIALNHREVWQPIRYTYQAEEFQYAFEANAAIDEALAKKISARFGLEKDYRGFRMNGKKLRITYHNDMIEIDTQTGKGLRETYRKRPVIGQMSFLHVTTSNYWIWYSDIFGLAMLTIALTGTFITSGKYSFRNRGWKLTALGVIFPLLFLIFAA
ncbi:MAG TPA: hypothetical protein DCM08_09240 [Microscillaceae bacterium]|jgi:hypothetical protein|nr:hypothetical protein [Microscillaceae bacterium]